MHQAKTHMKICFIGPQKSGKSSIIRVIFDDMKNHQTKNLESTLTPERNTFTLGDHFRIEITEIPGSTPASDFVSESDHLGLREQDVFIYVINCQNFSPETEFDRLKEIFDLTHRKNPQSWFHIFYHQVDLQMFVDQMYQQEDYIEKHFNDHLKLKMEGPGQKEAAFFRTSLYEYSVHLRVSQLINRFLNRGSDLVDRLLEKLNATCGARKVYLFDTQKQLFLFHSSSETNEGSLTRRVQALYRDRQVPQRVQGRLPLRDGRAQAPQEGARVQEEELLPDVGALGGARGPAGRQDARVAVRADVLVSEFRAQGDRERLHKGPGGLHEPGLRGGLGRGHSGPDLGAQH